MIMETAKQSSATLPTAVDAAWMTLDCDGLGLQYMRESLQPSVNPNLKKALMKFALAEDLLGKGDSLTEALSAAVEAKELFEKFDPQSNAVADALRLEVHASRLQVERLRHLKDTAGVKSTSQKLEQMALQHVKAFQKIGVKRGRAAMLLSAAEINLHKRGLKKREQALDAAEQAHFLCQELGDKPLEAMTELILAHIYIKTGPMEASLHHSTCALKISKDLGDKRGEAKALTAMSLAFAATKKLPESIKAASDALIIYEDLGAKRMQAFELYILSRWYLAQKEPQQSASAAGDALELFQELNVGQGWPLAAQSLAAFANSQSEGAQVPQRPAVSKVPTPAKASARELAAPPRSEDPALQVARQYQEIFRGDVQKWLEEKAFGLDIDQKTLPSKEETRQFMEAAKEMEAAFAEAGDKSGQARALLMVASAHRWADNYHAAVRNAVVSQSLFRSINDKASEWRTLCWQTSLHMVNDQHKEACRIAREAFKVSRWISEMVRTDTLLLMAQALFDALVSTAARSRTPRHVLQTQGEQALLAATEAAAFGRASDDRHRTASALLISGQVAFSTLKAELAMAAVNEAVPLFEEVNDKAGEAAARILEAEVHQFNGRFDAAYGSATHAKGLARAAGDEKLEHRALQIIQMAPPQSAAGEQRPATTASAASVQPLGQSSSSSGYMQLAGMQIEDVRVMMLKYGEEIMNFEEEVLFDTNLMDVGLDSLSALSFRNSLKSETGLKLPGTLMYDYPTMKEVAQHIVDLSRTRV